LQAYAGKLPWWEFTMGEMAIDNIVLCCYSKQNQVNWLGLGGESKVKLSTRAEYGLRAMFELASKYGQGPVPLRVIARDQEISENYLEQLIAVLRKAGLVESVRGPQGGYMLAAPPESITVGDVVRVVEGPIAPMDCVSEGTQADCGRAGCCASRVIWEKVRDSISEVLDGFTLADMVGEADRLSGSVK